VDGIPQWDHTTAELEALGLEKLEERFTVLEQTYSAKFKQR